MTDFKYTPGGFTCVKPPDKSIQMPNKIKHAPDNPKLPVFDVNKAVKYLPPFKKRKK